MSETIDTRAEALELAARGFHVFPLRPGTKAPGTTNGHKDATTDPERVSAMFRPGWDRAEKGIGIATEPSGLLVVDLDGEVGMAHLAEFPTTLTAITGRGAHLYYRGRGRSTAGAIAAGIDTRGAGGYVVAPPTRHPSGHRYRWRAAEPIADLPTSIADRLRPRSRPIRRRRVADPNQAGLLLRLAVERFRATGQGGRNDALNREAWHSRTLSTDRAFLALLWVAEGEAIGLEHGETIRTVASALEASVEEVEAWLA